MTTNCRPGDLAVIVRCHHPENLGAIVLVLRAVELAQAPSEPAWLVRAAGRKLLACGLSGRVEPTDEAKSPDAYLKPLRDQPGEDEVLRKVGLPGDATLKPKPQAEHAR